MMCCSYFTIFNYIYKYLHLLCNCAWIITINCSACIST